MRSSALVLAVFTLAACSRPSPPRAQVTRATPAQPAPAQPAQPAARATTPAATAVAVHPVEDEAEEQREIMEALRDISRFGPDEAGLRGFVGGLAHEAQRHDREGLARFVHEMTPDNARFELAFTFEGARRWRDRVVPGVDARAEALAARIGALQGDLTVRVGSALGSELADGQPHGFDPRVATVRTSLMPAVRFFHAEVVGSNGSVTMAPMAWLGGHWVWLGEPWALEAPLAPGAPTGPTSVTAR